MSRWLRLYPGTMRDPKFVSVALRTGQKKHMVVFVWLCILESASEMQAGGAYRLDPREVANFLECRPIDVTLILAGFEQDGLIGEGRVTKWGKRQYESEDGEPLSGAERTRLYRERQRDESVTTRDDAVTAAVTSASPNVTPEAEAESQTERKIAADDARADRRRSRPAKARAPGQRELFPATPIAGNPEVVPSALGSPAAMPETVAVAVPPGGFQYLKRLLDAAGPGLNQKAVVELRFHDLALPLNWRRHGCDETEDILPAVRRLGARAPPGAIQSWKYFNDAVFEARDVRLAPPPVIDVGRPQTERNHAARGKPNDTIELAQAFGRLSERQARA